MDAFHRERTSGWAESWLEEFEGSIADAAEEVRVRRSVGDSDEQRSQLEQEVAVQRARIVEYLEEQELQYAQSWPAIEPDVARPELFEVERDVIADLYAELFNEPALAAFDEELGLALGK